jgi:flagellar protein FlaG
MPIDFSGRSGITGLPRVSGNRPVTPANPVKPIGVRQELPPEVKSSPPPSALPDTPEDLDQAIRELNDYVQSLKRTINFEIDESSGRAIVRVLNQQTGELIRQIPSEEALAIARHLDAVQGVIVRKKV